MEQVLQALAVFRAIGSSNLTPLLSAMAAEISLDAEQIGQGLAIVEEAHNLARNTGMNHCDAEIHRLKGELLLQRINRHEAESCFEQAIETARKQDAKSFELRATISLAKYLLKENRQAEARERLTKICAWFTDGPTLWICGKRWPCFESFLKHPFAFLARFEKIRPRRGNGFA